MHEAAQMHHWQGRVDPEAGAERWHQRVEPFDPFHPAVAKAGLVVLGICSDAGVTRNEGRAGARNGPDAIRRALGSVAWHLECPLYDAGNLLCVKDDLECLQAEQARWVTRVLDRGHFPLLIGGGHEMALGTFLGVRRHLAAKKVGGAIGIVNFDAHFDLRSAERSTSGTPFFQISQKERDAGVPFRYLCLGVSEVANTAALFRRAESLGAQWLLDEELASWNLSGAEKRLRHFADSCDHLYLTIDLDVLPAAVAPGVSAPSPRGVPLEVVEHLVGLLKREGGTKLLVAEIAEMNPDFDCDGRTAKVAARLCHMVTRAR